MTSAILVFWYFDFHCTFAHIGGAISEVVSLAELNILVKMDDRHPKRFPLKARLPKWKDKLREKCLMRAQENRNQLLWSIRSAGKSVVKPKDIVVSAFGQIVSDELVKIKQLSQGDGHNDAMSDINNTLWDYEPSEVITELDKNEYEEIMLEMERLLHEDIEAELKQRDAALLEDYEKTCALEEESLAAALFEHMQLQEDQNGGLLCPICRRGYLNQRQQLIYCERCQLRLDVQCDQVDLELLQKRLSEVLEEHHSRGCKAQPRFCVEVRFDISALYVQCSMCDTFELVL